MSEDIIEVIVIDGRVRCVYLNEFRVVGSKPYVTEHQSVTRFKIPAGEIRKHLKRRSSAVKS